MPQYVVDKTVRALNEVGKSLKGAKILALGIAYKRDIDDMRESPAIYVMELLQEWGADIAYSDPNVPVFPNMREHYFDLQSVGLDAETIAGFDAVIVLTDHSDFDYEMIGKHASVLVDTRGRYKVSATNGVVRA
jgi:UDP-N-acetyl-D-glucosamine dehydrogenase